jgi:hypothetical protein
MYFYAGRPYIVATMPFHGISAYPDQGAWMLTIHPGCNMNLTGTAASSRKERAELLVPLRPSRDAAAGSFTRSCPASGKKRRRK